MVILQVLPALETGGVERGTVEMVQAIVAAGGTALVASAGGRMVAEVERAGGRHVGLKLMTKDPLNIWLNAGPLAGLIRREGVSLVHARSRAPAWSAWLASRRTGVPFVTTWHGVYGEEFPGKRLYNRVSPRATGWIQRGCASSTAASMQPCSTRRAPWATGCTSWPRPGACRLARPWSCCRRA
jgi:hypothetical protein